MLGLIIAAIIFLFSLLGSHPEDPLLLSVAATFTFLWYWHLVFAFFQVLISAAICAFGFFISGSKDKAEQKIASTFMIAAPLVAVFLLLYSSLFLGGVYLLDKGIDSTGEIVNQKYAISGAALYTLGLLAQVFGSISRKSLKKSE